MVKAPIIVAKSSSHPLSNAATITSSDVVAVETDVDANVVVGVSSNNLLIADNELGGVAADNAATAITTISSVTVTVTSTSTNTSGGNIIAASSNDNDNSNKVNNETHSMTTNSTDEHSNSSISSAVTSESIGTGNLNLNGNAIRLPTPILKVSGPTTEQGTQTDDDDNDNDNDNDNSSICSSTNSIRYLTIEPGEEELDDDGQKNFEVRDGNEEKCANLYLEENERESETLTRPKGNENDANDATLHQEETVPQADEDEEEETYCVGHFYGQDEEEVAPEKPPDSVAEQVENDQFVSSDDAAVDNGETPWTDDADLNAISEIIDNDQAIEHANDNKLNENANLSCTVTSTTVSLVVPKSYTIPHQIPQIIGGMMAAQQQPLPALTPPPSSSLSSHHHEQHQAQSMGNLLQPLHLATFGTHSGHSGQQHSNVAAVNQQISPTTPSTSGGSTSIQHHHHCVHHPHVHLHSPGHQPSSAGAVGTSAATGAPGHSHTHIFPLQVISLAQAPGTAAAVAAAAAAAAAAGATTAWPLVEAPIYVDANGEYRTYCPAHPQGPPPREHRVLLQLDAGVSLPLQVAGKRKVFRGESLQQF